MQRLSVVVPTLNEEQNIALLLKSLDQVLQKAKILYEVIVIDDNSTDATKKKVLSLKNIYPVLFFTKKGTPGKAHSLLEGFAKAKYEMICMIDADLQYPPAAIPSMLKKLHAEKADIVIAHRTKSHVGKLRNTLSRATRFFTKTVYDLPYDVQSGLKVFKKEIVERVSLSPAPWSFDLEFLLKARQAGYSITEYPIAFAKRHSGKSHLHFFQATMENAIAALKLKLIPLEAIPFTHKKAKASGRGFHYKGNEYMHYTDLPLRESVYYSLSAMQRLVLVVAAVLLVISLLLNWHLTIVVAISLLTILYFTDLLFNFMLIYRSFSAKREVDVTKKKLDSISETDWPTYTIYCPLYKEWEVVPQFTEAMQALDYPKNKLQVMLLLEEDDTETINKIGAMDLPSYFSIDIIPHSKPKTKPKALNYALHRTKGEFAVIYDAEDIPEPQQLKKAVLAFRKADAKTICIQAKLNFYNPEQNILTRLFTAEYSLWFDLVLTGLQSINAPIPLGGTSNHFRTKDLRVMQGWDPFNVTEDADLGMRIFKRGYKTVLINSYTMEEANSDVFNWLKQRSRWIKGYIQTYFVHMRNPKEYVTARQLRHFFIFQLVIGAKILSMLINPLMWLMTISYFALNAFAGDFIRSLYITPIFYMGVFSMVIGNFLYMYYYMLGAAKREQWSIVPYAFLTPLYWLGMSIAASFALWEYAFKPHYWHKTKHGLHLTKDKSVIDFTQDEEPRIAAIPV